ncbi:MAG: hypothetical protein HY901_07960 [Deltaproteobacteria bacterium]|nr:hypothetical protein [Deltaproteobacteria bacterium]
MHPKFKKLTLELHEHQVEHLTDFLREQLCIQLDCAADACDAKELERASSHIFDAQMALELEGVVRQAEFRAAHPVAASITAAVGEVAKAEVTPLHQPGPTA